MGAGGLLFLECALRTEEKVEQQPPPPDLGFVQPFDGLHKHTFLGHLAWWMPSLD